MIDKPYFIEIKFVTTDLRKMNELISDYTDKGFSCKNDMCQILNDNDLYWTTMQLNNGLAKEENERND